MISAPNPDNEFARQQAVDEYERLSQGERDALDEIANLASRICDVPVSLVTFISNDVQLIRGAKGLDIDQTSREVAFCAHTILDDSLFQVEDTSEDERFFDNPLVTDTPNIRFYAGYPLQTSSGERLGALCVLDEVPKKLTESQSYALQVLADQVIKRLELSRANRLLNKRNEELEEVNAMRTKLLSILAHDIRSPMTSLRMILDLIEDGDISAEERKEFVQNMNEVMLETDRMIEGIAEWGKASAMQGEFPTYEVDIHELIEDIFDLTSGQAALKKVKLVNHVEDGMVARVNTNVFRLVLRNLVSNAVKYSSDSEVAVQASIAEDVLSVRVIDHGMGIDAEKVGRLFNPIEHISERGTHGEKGTGAGLLFSKEMIERCRGSIALVENSAEGCTFEFTFPQI